MTRSDRSSSAVAHHRTITPVSSARPAPSELAVPYRVAARQLLRDTLLDASRGLLADRPWAQITMSEVAQAAGVSRQTLYKEFGSRDEFAQAFVIREGARFLNAVEEAILNSMFAAETMTGRDGFDSLLEFPRRVRQSGTLCRHVRVFS